MAVIVGSTEVIDDNLKLQNITGANGKYDDFQPNVETLSSAPTVSVSMNYSVLDLTLSGNASMTVTNKASGRVSILTLDTSSSAHTPSFDSNVKWAADTEPTWGDHRYWNISLVAWDSIIVRASAVGFDS